MLMPAQRTTFPSTPKLKKNPFKHAKSIVNLGPVNVCHVFDFEDNDEVHTTQFRNTLSSMKRAGSSGRSIKYVSGYSNYTFELWILLHKQDARRSLAHRRDYLQPINSAFNEHFEDLHAYKRENNFKRVLSKMSLDDVVRAIERAKTIDRINRENRLHFREHCGYTYCLDNPATDLWMTIEKILSTAE